MDYKPRHLTKTWADEDSLTDTHWKLFIQRWQIDVVTQTEPKKTMCEGMNEDFKPDIKYDIEPERIHLKLKLEKHSVRVNLDFEEVKIKDEEQEWKQLPGKKRSLEKNLSEFNQGSSDSDGVSERKAQIERELRELEKRQNELGPRIDKYNLINSVKSADLSCTIILQLDNTTVVDVARIGIFAIPEPKEAVHSVK